MTIRFHVPGTPAGKGRPRMTRSGHCYTPSKTVEYESKIAWCFQQAAPDHVPIKGPVIMEVYVYMPIPASWSKKKAEAAKKDTIRPTTKPDLDNILKMMDALNGVAWKDDAQVVSVLIQKHYSEAAGLSVYITWEDDK